MNYKIILSLVITSVVLAVFVLIGQTRSANTQNNPAANKVLGGEINSAPNVANKKNATKTDKYNGEKIVKTEAEWRKQLTAQQFYILREKRH